MEVYLQGQWGTVCGDHWDIRHATVVRSQLGYLDAMSVEDSSEFGQGKGSIHLQNIQCLGNETIAQSGKLIKVTVTILKMLV